MSANNRDELIKQSDQAIEKFVNEHPQFYVDPHQPDYRGGTNLVTYGQYEHQPVVFKYFVKNYRWRHETFCLQYFARTGYVPTILAVVPEQLIVMTRLPGYNIGGEELNQAQKKQVSQEIGQAIATLTKLPLPPIENRNTSSDFEQTAWRTDVRRGVEQYLRVCRRIQKGVPAYQTAFFAESLRLVEQHLDIIDHQPPILFHEDISNLNVAQGHFQGFYDLEMCRVGTAAMQLGVIVGLCRPHWLDEPWLNWGNFLQGYQKETDQELNEVDLRLILAMSHFYHYIRICRWGEWNGDPMQVHHLKASVSDAKHHLNQMRQACQVLRPWIDMEKWFPSLR